MTHDTENAAADIAWLRKLAEDGADAPMRGASILMMGGLVYGSAAVFHWLAAAEIIDLSINSASLVWGVATVLFWILLAIMIPRVRRAGASSTVANRASGIAWGSVGWGIFAMAVAMGVLGWRLGPSAAPALFTLIPSIIMVFYGAGWAVSAGMFKSRTMWNLSLASFAAAPVMAVFAGQATQYLAYAIALFGLMALPGYLLMRAANR
ncbi:hypothetical protein ACIQC9_13565 [Brevundimonas sp. NPDC092305]|uniref:hypothetical protein n=1 Tax=Brevundimonas sp. NPDC092305 TaxID=3363957 RepID=UPI0038256912